MLGGELIADSEGRFWLEDAGRCNVPAPARQPRLVASRPLAEERPRLAQRVDRRVSGGPSDRPVRPEPSPAAHPPGTVSGNPRGGRRARETPGAGGARTRVDRGSDAWAPAGSRDGARVVASGSGHAGRSVRCEGAPNGQLSRAPSGARDRAPVAVPVGRRPHRGGRSRRRARAVLDGASGSGSPPGTGARPRAGGGGCIAGDRLADRATYRQLADGAPGRGRPAHTAPGRVRVTVREDAAGGGSSTKRWSWRRRSAVNVPSLSSMAYWMRCGARSSSGTRGARSGHDGRRCRRAACDARARADERWRGVGGRAFRAGEREVPLADRQGLGEGDRTGTRSRSTTFWPHVSRMSYGEREKAGGACTR